jgi:hypothetical protein
MAKPKIVLLIFVSGKIVLTGAKVREEIYQAFESIYPVLTGIVRLIKNFEKRNPIYHLYLNFCMLSLLISFKICNVNGI